MVLWDDCLYYEIYMGERSRNKMFGYVRWLHACIYGTPWELIKRLMKNSLCIHRSNSSLLEHHQEPYQHKWHVTTDCTHRTPPNLNQIHHCWNWPGILSIHNRTITSCSHVRINLRLFFLSSSSLFCQLFGFFLFSSFSPLLLHIQSFPSLVICHTALSFFGTSGVICFFSSFCHTALSQVLFVFSAPSATLP